MVFRSGNNVVEIGKDNTIGGYDQDFNSDNGPDPFGKRLQDYGVVFFSPKLTTAEVYCTRSKNLTVRKQCKKISLRRYPIYMYKLTADINEFANTDDVMFQEYISEKYRDDKENPVHFPFKQNDKGTWDRKSSNPDADYKFFKALRDHDTFKYSPGVISGNELILFIRPGEKQIEQRFTLRENDREHIYFAQDDKPAAEETEQPKSASFRF